MFTIEETTRPFKVIVFGDPKVGKTTLACKSKNAAMIDLENGCPHIKIPKKLVNTYDEAINAMDGAAKSNFDTIIIDSLTYLEKLMFQKIAKEAGKKNIMDIPFYKGFETASSEFDVFLQKMHILNKTKNIICIAHAQTNRVSDPELGEYDEISPALHKKWCIFAGADFDGVFCMKSHLIINDERATPTNKTFIYSQPVTGIKAGSRFKIANKIERDNWKWEDIKFQY